MAGAGALSAAQDRRPSRRLFSREQEHDVVERINAAQPDILWVGMGAPSELAFAMRNRERLRNVGIIKTSGGLFDFLSGKNRRAPKWMQAAGLEWAFRTWLQPRRLTGRYMMTNPHAVCLLLTQTRASPVYRTAHGNVG
jgi:N-acetylglucosaminyldiphosphoundecaprenol N-acetyl-beta-D-mannosaminyltransferase